MLYETKPDKAYDLFTEIVKKGNEGLVMTTTFPKKLQKRFKDIEPKILWMSEAKADDAVNPRRLDFEVTQNLTRIIRDNDSCAILVDCFGYLELNNGFEKVRKFIKKTLDSVSINNGTLLMVIDPDAFSSETAQSLAQDFDYVEDLRKTEKEPSGEVCKQCGAQVKPGAFFCEICGYNLKGGPPQRPGVHPFVSNQQQYPGQQQPQAGQQSASQEQDPQKPQQEQSTQPTQEKNAHPPSWAAQKEPQRMEQVGTTQESAAPSSPPSSTEHVADVDWYSRGVQLERQGKDMEALEAYNKAIQKNPQDGKAWFNKAVILQIVGRVEEALQSYDKSLEITPNDIEILSNKGIALRSLGRVEEALQAYDKALDIDPTDAGVWSNKGVALRSLGRTEESIACYKKALEYNPNDAGVWSNLGVAYHKLNQLEKAVECYDKALKIDPGRRVARRNKEIALNAM